MSRFRERARPRHQWRILQLEQRIARVENQSRLTSRLLSYDMNLSEADQEAIEFRLRRLEAVVDPVDP